MVRKAHLRSKFFAFFGLVLGVIGCQKHIQRQPDFAAVDVSKIPTRVVLADDRRLQFENGICVYDQKPFSGFVREKYETDTLKSVQSYLNGKLHGISRSFYPDGKPRHIRQFKGNLSYGKQIGFWENGHPKFEFNYCNDRREGVQKQWYEDGKLYTWQTFRHDSENGMQKAWRTSGKLFANYEVKGGICYGLQKTNLCYTLRNQKIK